MTMRTLLLLSALIAGLLGSPSASPVPVPVTVPVPVPVPVPIPYHAFCKTLWLLGLPCADVRTKLVQQIKAFNPQNLCDECHYRLVAATNGSIRAIHTSLDFVHAEVIEFTLQHTVLTDSCRVFAQSASMDYTRLLDGGLNYCNLYDLLKASGLNLSPGFLEMTNEWACLGYVFAPCKT